MAAQPVVLRPDGWKATGDDGRAWLARLRRPGHVYRGMSEAEYLSTVARGRPVQSDARYCLPGEGTCFAENPADAESYANFGSDDPRMTGRSNYLVEAEIGPGMTRHPDGYIKTPDPVPVSFVKRVWRMEASEDKSVVLAVRVK